MENRSPEGLTDHQLVWQQADEYVDTAGADTPVLRLGMASAFYARTCAYLLLDGAGESALHYANLAELADRMALEEREK